MAAPGTSLLQALAGTRTGATRADWDILGVGDIDIDMFIHVQRLPRRDDKVVGELLGEFPGGMIANVCCAASHLGARTAMSGAVGADRYGAAALTGLRDQGVDTQLVRVLDGARTFYCVVLLDDSGEKALTAVDTDCRLPRREDTDPEAFGRARLVHLMGDDAAFAEWAAVEAQRRKVLVSVDLEESATARGAAALRPLLRHVDIAFLNEPGYRRGFGDDPVAALVKVLELGAAVAVITQGSHGALVRGPGGMSRIRPHSVPVVDSTGAGDCFIGAFLTCLLNDGADLRGCAEFGSAAAALSLSAVGARNALPDREDVLALISHQVTRVNGG